MRAEGLAMSALEHVVLALPFRGTWLTRNSPPRRGPSHVTHLFATTYAVDFIAVQGRRTATTRDRRSLLSTEPVERFFAFGQAILAPAAGRVLSVHDSEADHEARRSRLALVPYMLTQAARARAGAAGLAGNHVILELDDRRAYVVLAPARGLAAGGGGPAGRRRPGARACGNSGNSTQPHLHVQVMEGTDPFSARGLPMSFQRYRLWPRSGGPAVVDRAGSAR
jgi:hypothetical protein